MKRTHRQFIHLCCLVLAVSVLAGTACSPFNNTPLLTPTTENCLEEIRPICNPPGLSTLALPTRQTIVSPLDQPAQETITSPLTLSTSTPGPTSTPTLPTLSPTLPPATATLCPEVICNYPGSLVLALPIPIQNNTQVDPSYRFGSSQGKKRDVHHGVEFLNPAGAPVLAAADGKVIVAGDDKKNIYSPYKNFYGNLVILQHNLTPEILPNLPESPSAIFTLYAHLSEILVHPGEMVKAGQEIGKVGMTGGATGPHLHFEVRLGENQYATAHNPELWLKMLPDENGVRKGALAGRVLDPLGHDVAVKGIVIQHLTSGPGSPADREIYLDSYEETTLIGQPPWRESFGVGDLPAGWYKISFPRNGLQSQDVQVLPGQVTVVTFQVDR